jgi:hypothetical protein
MGDLFARLTGRPAFWSSVIFLLLFPWVPLLAEWGATGHVKSSSLQIFVALYGLGLGAASQDEVRFGYGVLAAIMFSISYGSILAMENSTVAEPGGGFNSVFWWWVTMLAGVSLFIWHAAERYTRHVKDGTPFFEWLSESGEG